MTGTMINPAERVQSLIEITQSLSEIFSKENELLTNQRARDIAPLQAEKARLAAAYAQSIRDIASNRTVVDGADSALLRELREITKTFEQRAARQRALLDGASLAAEGIVKAVAQEAAAAQSRPGYDDAGEKGTASPISVNENA